VVVVTDRQGRLARKRTAVGGDRVGEGFALRPPPSKLRPPRSRVELVDRHGVVSRLLRATEPVIAVTAPAGSGKTVAVTQWAARESRPVAWLRLDGSDNDPLVFLAGLVVDLDRVVGLDADVLDLLRHDKAPRKELLLAEVLDAVATARPFGLVLDDCHLVQDRWCWHALEAVVDELPEGASLVFVSRVELPLPLGRLRAQGRLVELGLGDLALDHGETRELLLLHDVDDADDAVDALLELTEGWATGAYLATLAGRDVPVQAWLPGIRGDQRAIASYLLDEVVAQQPPDVQAFLEQTALLDELTAPLCAAVTARQDAGVVLRRLVRENVFVSALDDHDERFRYHHLFAELLRARLAQRGDAEAKRSHRLAAAWYEAQGQAESAIRHYLAAGDVEATVDLAALTADSMLEKNLVESARRLLLLYTREQLLAYPALAIAAGWVFALAAGTLEEQRSWARIIVGLEFEDGPTPLPAASLRSSWLVVVGELCPDGLTQARRAFDEAWRLERHRPGDWRRMVVANVARTHYLSGAADRAAAMYVRILDELETAGEGLDPDRAGCHAYLALIAQDAGRWEEAEELVVKAEGLDPKMGLDYSTHFSGYLDMLLSHLRLLSHKGDSKTMEFARMIDDFMVNMVHHAPWVLLMADVTLGEVALEQGDLAAARRWSDRAQRTLAGWSDAGLYGRRALRLADALERRTFEEPLTPAERRVLELLPSHLPIKRVAQRLNLSQSTVKTHLRAIYRKLEVSSRVDAVERARAMGLLHA
jgi:LuxR family maltose regulon positive regulatory protein